MTCRSLSSNKPISNPGKTLGNQGLIKSVQLILLSLVLLLPGCGPSADPAIDKNLAQAKLAKMKQAKSQQQAYEAEQQRLAEEKAAAEEAARQEAAERAAAEAAKPHYDPTRLSIAGKWRQWADITIPDLNIKCWLKTNWKNGNMHLRLALLGDKTALRLFQGTWPYFRLVFADQMGNNLHQCILSTKDLHWDENGLRNSGVPTLEFESDDQVSLEVYESIVQWNLKWEDHID